MWPMKLDWFRVPPGKKVSMRQYDPGFTGAIRDKDEAKNLLKASVDELSRHQVMLYAQNTYALLVIFQAMDAAGKDSTIKHVMSGVDPHGCEVHSFKAPTKTELDHDFLWRTALRLPERGKIGIHNRSHYEEVLAVRVHPELLDKQDLPEPTRKLGPKLWKQRFDDINAFEKYLVNNGITVLKFFLNVSKEEQKKRFLERIDRPEKNWKFEPADLKVRGEWDEYMRAYEETFRHTSTAWAPWYVIPADHKWFTRVAVSYVINKTLDGLKLAYPKVTPDQMAELQRAKKALLAERDGRPRKPA